MAPSSAKLEQLRQHFSSGRVVGRQLTARFRRDHEVEQHPISQRTDSRCSHSNESVRIRFAFAQHRQLVSSSHFTTIKEMHTIGCDAVEGLCLFHGERPDQLLPLVAEELGSKRFHGSLEPSKAIRGSLMATNE